MTYSPDKPIKLFKDNKIQGRDIFAKELAELILKYKEGESLVIGLTGAWGSGKTSLINLALEYIQRNSDTRKTIIIEFNPWNFSDQNQLIFQFFEHINDALGTKDTSEDIKELKRVLKKYSRIIEPLKFVPLFSKGIAFISYVFKSLVESFKEQEINLKKTKEELNRLIEKLEIRLIITIDDIDRLSSNEIKQIFQLVKTLGDFSNTIYLLSFDKNVVSESLKEIQKGDSFEYLEKIIQVSFDIPNISKSELQKILFNKLNELFKKYQFTKWDDFYWPKVIQAGFLNFFKNIRDVNRFINSLKFTIGFIGKELNSVDFLVITALQIFEPKIFDLIKSSKFILIDDPSDLETSFGIGEKNPEIVSKKKEKFIELISQVKNLSKEKLIEIFEIIFPKTINYSDKSYNNYYQDLRSWRKDCRVCSPDYFNLFFKLSVSEEELTTFEIENIINSIISEENFSKIIKNLIKKNKINKFIERLQDYTIDNVINLEKSKIIAKVLVNLGDNFSNKEEITYSDIPISIRIIFYQILSCFKDEDQKFSIYKDIIQNSTESIHIPLCLLCYEKDKNNLNRNNFEDLKSIILKKVNEWAKNGKLKKYNKIVGVIYRWIELAGDKEVKEFLEQFLTSDDELVNFINFSCTGISSSHKGFYKRIDLNNLKKFLDIDSCYDRMNNIKNSNIFNKFNEYEKESIDLFLDTYTGKITDDF